MGPTTPFGKSNLFTHPPLGFDPLRIVYVLTQLNFYRIQYRLVFLTRLVIYIIVVRKYGT